MLSAGLNTLASANKGDIAAKSGENTSKSADLASGDSFATAFSEAAVPPAPNDANSAALAASAVNQMGRSLPPAGDMLPLSPAEQETVLLGADESAVFASDMRAMAVNPQYAFSETGGWVLRAPEQSLVALTSATTDQAKSGFAVPTNTSAMSPALGGTTAMPFADPQAVAEAIDRSNVSLPTASQVKGTSVGFNSLAARMSAASSAQASSPVGKQPTALDAQGRVGELALDLAGNNAVLAKPLLFAGGQPNGGLIAGSMSPGVMPAQPTMILPSEIRVDMMDAMLGGLNSPESAERLANELRVGLSTSPREALSSADAGTNARAPEGLSAPITQLSSAQRINGLPSMTGVLVGDLSHSPDSAEFPQEVMTKLRLLQEGGRHEARLNLHPAELGRLQISVTTDGDNTKVVFTVDNSQARDALEQSMPRLRELLAQSGLALSEGTVFEQRQQGQQQDGLIDGSAQDHEYSAVELAQSDATDELDISTDNLFRSQDSEPLLDAYA